MDMRTLRRLLTQFENAARNDAFKGAAHPDDWDMIEAHYKAVRARLEEHLAREIGITS